MVDYYQYAKDDTQYEIVLLERSGTTVTATTLTPHNLPNGNDVTVSGADQAEYNGLQTITSVADAFTFTYEIVGAPATPATGTIVVNNDLHEFIFTGTIYEFGKDGITPHVPADATLVDPGAPPAGQVAVYNDVTDSSSFVDDNRGDIYYLAPDYEPLTQEVIGDLPVGALTAIPLSVLKDRKKAELFNEFEKQIQKNITVAATLLRADYNSVIRYMQLIDYDGAIPVKPSPIILPDYSTVTKTKAELTAINSAIAVRQNNSYSNYNTKLSAINSAVDEAALEAIDLTTGWPA